MLEIYIVFFIILQLALQIQNIICAGKENKSDKLSPEDILAQLINEFRKRH